VHTDTVQARLDAVQNLLDRLTPRGLAAAGSQTRG